MIYKCKVHYSPYGEWGGEKVNCGRYFTTDVAHSANPQLVTCKYCKKLFETTKKQTHLNGYRRE